MAGDISDIHWMMSEDQYGLFMNCIMHNLAEIEEHNRHKKSSPMPEATKVPVASMAVTPAATATSNSNQAVFLDMVMTFHFHSLKFTCKIPSVESEGFEDLACLAVDNFSILMAKKTDTSMELDLAFKRFTLTDEQPNTNRLYRVCTPHAIGAHRCGNTD
jgi:hypothetical protein